MRAYIIHREERKDRLINLQREINQQGIDAIIVQGGEHRWPEKAIWLGHQNAIKMALNDGEKYPIIMEDDVKFVAPRAFERFVKLSENFVDRGIFFGGMSHGLTTVSSNGVAKIISSSSGMHCYRLNEDHAKYMIDFDSPQRCHIDRWVTDNIECYVTMPMVAIQYSGFSDSKNQNMDYDNLFRRYDWWDGKEGPLDAIKTQTNKE